MNIDLLALSGAGTVLLALIFFYFPWQSFVIDQTRQRLFECRDRWFDYSQKLTSPRDRAGAAGIRAELNYMIRQLHEFTVPVLAYCIVLHMFSRDDEAEREFNRVMNGFESAEVRAEAQKVFTSAVLQMAFCMWRRSILALVLVPVIIGGLVLISATLGSVKSLRYVLERAVTGMAAREHRQIVPRC